MNKKRIEIQEGFIRRHGPVLFCGVSSVLQILCVYYELDFFMKYKSTSSGGMMIVFTFAALCYAGIVLLYCSQSLTLKDTLYEEIYINGRLTTTTYRLLQYVYETMTLLFWLLVIYYMSIVLEYTIFFIIMNTIHAWSIYRIIRLSRQFMQIVSADVRRTKEQKK